jgi:putative ABC transport system permease protein
MADFWVDLKKAPAAAALRAAAVPGVSIAQTRIAFPVVMDLPGEALPVGGIVVALPATPTPILNNIIIRAAAISRASAARGHRVAEIRPNLEYRARRYH